MLWMVDRWCVIMNDVCFLWSVVIVCWSSSLVWVLIVDVVLLRMRIDGCVMKVCVMVMSWCLFVDMFVVFLLSIVLYFLGRVCMKWLI